MLGLTETGFLKQSFPDLMDSRSRFVVLPQPVPVSESITSTTEQHSSLKMLQSSRSAGRKTQPVWLESQTNLKQHPEPSEEPSRTKEEPLQTSLQENVSLQ